MRICMQTRHYTKFQMECFLLPRMTYLPAWILMIYCQNGPPHWPLITLCHRGRWQTDPPPLLLQSTLSAYQWLRTWTHKQSKRSVNTWTRLSPTPLNTALTHSTEAILPGNLRPESPALVSRKRSKRKQPRKFKLQPLSRKSRSFPPKLKLQTFIPQIIVE